MPGFPFPSNVSEGILYFTHSGIGSADRVADAHIYYRVVCPAGLEGHRTATSLQCLLGLPPYLTDKLRPVGVVNLSHTEGRPAEDRPQSAIIMGCGASAPISSGVGAMTVAPGASGRPDVHASKVKK